MARGVAKQLNRKGSGERAAKPENALWNRCFQMSG